MTTTEIISLILNFVLSGGLIAAVTAIATLRSSVREAEAKAEQALAEAKRMHAEATGTELVNEEKTLQIFNRQSIHTLRCCRLFRVNPWHECGFNT